MKQKINMICENVSALQGGQTSAIGLLEYAFERASLEEGKTVYTQLFERTARAEAEAEDSRLRAGVQCGPLAGVPVSVKDLFDVAGQVTRAGSRVLSGQSPASQDAEAVRRLRQAGAVITGHTNMTEFAYSGLGLNPHYGTPTNPLNQDCIPGGSSSGAGVAVARNMAAASLGTDTGGSVRIPAAFCGLTGFKPTQNRVPLTGSLPLSPTLDSIGPIAASVDCCARMDAVLSGHPEKSGTLTPQPIRGLRLLVPTNYVLDDLDEAVGKAFEHSLQRLSDAGAVLHQTSIDELNRLPELGRGGGFTAAESFYLHQKWLEKWGHEYDPRVRVRIEAGASISAADYLGLQQNRNELMRLVDQRMLGWDACVMPTVAVTPPKFSDLEDDDEYSRINRLVLRNPTVANLLGLCAISLPCHQAGEDPVGLMLVARAMNDNALLSIAAGVEALFFGNT